MTADELDALDHRARAAATDLRHQAAARPRPAFDPERATAPAPAPLRPVGRQMLAVAAVVLAIAATATVAVIASRGDDRRDQPAAPVESAPLQGWELSEVPDGFVLSGAGEGRSDRASTSGSQLAIYGPADDDPQVGVARGDGFAVASVTGEGSEAERFDVDGIAAVDVSPFGLAPRAVVVDDPTSPGDGIVAISATLDRDQLARIALATTVDGVVARVEASTLPGSWQLIADDPAGPFVGSATALARDGGLDGRGTIYLEAEPDVDAIRTISITSRVGDARTVAAVRLTSDDVTTAEVRGAPALVATADLLGGTGQSTSVTWQPKPGVVVQLVGWNLARDEVLAAAESAEPVSEARWQDLVRQSQLGQLDPIDPDPDGGQAIQVAEGELEDGTPFVLRAGRDQGPDLQVAVADPGGGSTSSSSAFGSASPDGAPPLRAGATTELGGRRFQAAFTAPEVTTVVVRGGGRELTRVRTQAMDLGALDRDALGELYATSRWFVVELPVGADELVLLDATGSQISTHPVDETGADPDGSTVTTVVTGN